MASLKMLITGVWLCGLVGGATRGSDIKFPGPDPGAAHVSLNAEGAALSNDDLVMRWAIVDGAPRPAEADDRIAHRAMQFDSDRSDCFTLLLDQGKTLAASQCQCIGLKSTALAANPSAPRWAEQLPGQQLLADFIAPDHSLTIHWRAELRDDGNDVRQFISIAANTAPVQIRRVIQPVFAVANESDASVIGSAPGAPIVDGDFFIAAEFPTAKNTTEHAVNGQGATLVGTINRETKMRPGEAVTPRQPLEFSSVIGVTPPGQLRRGFLYYLERERAHPYHSYLHYNSWCDIHPNAAQGVERIEAFENELVNKRGVSMQGFVFDDGWDDPSHLWQLSDSQFPQGLAPLVAAAKKGGMHLGLWLSPWGGYGKAAAQRVAAAKAQDHYGYILNGFALSDPNYLALVNRRSADFMKNDEVNFFKFDGILASEASEGEAIRQLCQNLRGVNPDVFCLVSTGTWGSPFFLMYGDSIWRGGGDGGFVGKGAKRQQWLNFRDGQTYSNIVKRQPLFPLNALMLHGISCLSYGPWSELNPSLLRDEFRSYFSSGCALRELYVNPTVLSQQNWDDLAEAAKWAQANNDVLVDSHWIGGDPSAEQVYGWASWAPRKGILMLRNPSDTPQSFSLDISKAFELPDGAPRRYLLKRPWKDQNQLPAIEATAGMPQSIWLNPFEVLAFEALPQP